MKIQSWPEDLNAFIDTRRRVPFEWGRQDCALFAADWILVATGTDPALKYRNRYKTAQGAARVLKHASLHQLFTEACGTPIWAALGQRGDIALLHTDVDGKVVETDVTDGRETVGVIIGTMVACPGKDGLVFAPLAAALNAWRVT